MLAVCMSPSPVGSGRLWFHERHEAVEVTQGGSIEPAPFGQFRKRSAFDEHSTNLTRSDARNIDNPIIRNEDKNESG